jgi:hypothetical protein
LALRLLDNDNSLLEATDGGGGGGGDLDFRLLRLNFTVAIDGDCFSLVVVELDWAFCFGQLLFKSSGRREKKILYVLANQYK